MPFDYGQRICSLAMISSECLTYGDDMNSFIRQYKAQLTASSNF